MVGGLVSGVGGKHRCWGSQWTWALADRVPSVSSDPASGKRSFVAVGAVVAAALGLVLVGWLGWRLVTSDSSGSAGSEGMGSPSGGTAAVDSGELVALAPGSGVELRVLGWQHTTAGDLGSATAVATLRNVDSPYTEFILDVAAVSEPDRQILGFGTAQVTGLAPGALGSFTLTIPQGVPSNAELGVANLWGRAAGDPQIHPISFGAAVGADGGTRKGAGQGAAPWTEPQLMGVASQFAASVAAMQADCRSDQSLAGLVCLSRRNFPDFLVAAPARDFITGRPYFHQETQPTQPPRAFDVTAPGDVVACVGQRIDKQTSDQVAILGSCSQRGLYPGDGEIQASRKAAPELPQLPAGAARSSSPVGTGGLPGTPVTDMGRAPADYGASGIGKTVVVGPFAVTVDGVQVGMTNVPGLPSPVGTYTLVTMTVTNRGADQLDVRSLDVTVGDGRGGVLNFVGDGWPPQPTTLAPGASATGVIAMDLQVDQTATDASLRSSTSGEQVTVSLLPPPS